MGIREHDHHRDEPTRGLGEQIANLVDLQELERRVHHGGHLRAALRSEVEARIRHSSTNDLLALTVTRNDGSARTLRPAPDADYVRCLEAYMRSKQLDGVVLLASGTEALVEQAVLEAIAGFYASSATLDRLTAELVRQLEQSREVHRLLRRAFGDEVRRLSGSAERGPSSATLSPRRPPRP